MRLPTPRGPLGAALMTALVSDPGAPTELSEAMVNRALMASDPLSDDDLHLTLWVMYELHYRGFDDVDAAWEWDPGVLRTRRAIETVFEQALRAAAASSVTAALEAGEDLVGQIEHVIDSVPGVDLARFVQREATSEQVLELLAQRSVYTLKESDPSSFVLPRIDGGAKTALAELLYDEYGAGRPERLHSRLYAEGLQACGLDPAYGGYVDQVPGHVLATNNAVTFFGLHRRLRGSALGHLAAFEATSSLPCRRFAAGIRRLGLPDEMWHYFDEHVEADAVHEQVALSDICGRFVTDEPELRADVLFGAVVCQQLEAASGRHTLQAWQAGRSCLVSTADAVPA